MFLENSRKVTEVKYLESPSNENPDTTKNVPVIQVKCDALLNDRGQTYAGLIKWQMGTWCEVSGKIP